MVGFWWNAISRGNSAQKFSVIDKSPNKIFNNKKMFLPCVL